MFPPPNNDDTLRDPNAIAARRQRHLIELLACPKCRAKVGLTNACFVESAVACADLVCISCGEVGLINAFKPSFFQRDRDDVDRAPGLVPEWMPISLDTLEHHGEWTTVHEGIHGGSKGAELSGDVTGSGVRFELLTHLWSGRVRLDFGGESQEIDLRSEQVGRHVAVFINDRDERQPWKLTLLDGGISGFEQVILCEIYQYVQPAAVKPLTYVVENFGNPYPPRFEELLREFNDPDAAILDLGGGDRRHHDPRVLNLEYLPYRRVDLYADGLQLPFADHSFDLIMSQAVLEHVPDPFLAVSEMQRVLKPGGRVYAEFAFMQPLHAVPFHFFNITPHGATLLFEKWDDVHISSFGGLGATTRWFFQLVNADGKIGSERAATVIEHLDALDLVMAPHELEMLSSAVAVEATCPS